MEHHGGGYVPREKHEPAQFRHAAALRNIPVRRGRIRLLPEALERYVQICIQLLDKPFFFLYLGFVNGTGVDLE